MIERPATKCARCGCTRKRVDLWRPLGTRGDLVCCLNPQLPDIRDEAKVKRQGRAVS